MDDQTPRRNTTPVADAVIFGGLFTIAVVCTVAVIVRLMQAVF